MAEIVNRNNEEILPQFEEIVNLNLFSPSEIKEVIRRHTEYEYKSVRREKHVKDFQDYINYKSNFLSLVRIRMKNIDKKNRRRVERMLVRHISKLYDNTIKYFSTDSSLWLNYIDFMIKERNYAKVVVLYDSLLGFHMGEPDLFVRAAKFLMKYAKDVDLARKTLFKGIRLHKRNPTLYQEFFKIELDFAAKKRRQAKEDAEKLNKDPVLRGKSAEVVCLSAFKVIDDVDFKFSLLEICANYKFAKLLHKKIYKILKDKHYYEEKMWKKIALLVLSGVDYEVIDMTSCKCKDLFKQRVWRCYHVFLKAVKTVATESMWFYFIDTFFELLKSHPEKYEYINKFLSKLMARSDVQDILKENHYLCWIESLEEFHPLEKLISFIDNAVNLYQQNVKLWLKKLQYHLGQRDSTMIKEIFMRAHKNLKDEQAQYTLWQFMLQSCVDLSVTEINTFFENLMKESPVTYPTLRPLYLDWVISKNNLDLARNVFTTVSQIPPYNIDLYKKMIGMELSQSNIDVKRVRQLYETACLYFGSGNSELWLNYVRFEKLYGDPTLVANIYWSAVKQLEPTLSDKFIAEYSIFKTNE